MCSHLGMRCGRQTAVQRFVRDDSCYDFLKENQKRNLRVCSKTLASWEISCLVCVCGGREGCLETSSSNKRRSHTQFLKGDIVSLREASSNEPA